MVAALAAAALLSVAPLPVVQLERADELVHDLRTGRSVATGGVRIRRDSFVLEADTASIQGSTVEAEGRVVLSDGVDVVGGRRAEYDFESQSGVVESARGVWGGVHVAADRLVIHDSRSAVAEGGALSPCALEGAFSPLFKADRFEILRGKRIRSRFLRVQVGPIPILFFPILSLPAPSGGLVGTKTAPAIRLSTGRGDFEGLFARSGVDYDVGPFGTGTLHVDFRQRVGWAFGEDHVFDLPPGRGKLRTDVYWADVRDGRSRSRGRARYIGDLTDRFSFRSQVHRVSDRGFVRDFFFREFVEEEPPASDATFTYRGRAWVGRLTWVGNVNRDDFSEPEYLPEGEVRLLPRRLPGGFVAEGEAAMARIGLEDVRLDTEYTRTRGRARLSRPTPVGPLFTVTPFVGADVAHYSRDDRTGREGGTRSLPSAGFTIESLLVGRLGDRWRHIVRPSLTFEHVERTGLNPTDIILVDPADRLRDGDAVSIEMDHRFVRRRSNGSIRRIGRILLSTFWDADMLPDRWGDVRVDARLSPTERVVFSLDGSYDAVHNLIERADLALSYKADSWNASFSLVRSNGGTPAEDQLQIGGGAAGWVNDRWWAEARLAFDAEEGTLDQGRYGLTHRGECWTVGFGFEDQRQLDRDSVFVVFGLTPFGTPAEVEFGGI